MWRLPLSTAKLVLFLFSFLEASAFYCRQHRHIITTSTSGRVNININININTEDSISRSSPFSVLPKKLTSPLLLALRRPPRSRLSLSFLERISIVGDELRSPKKKRNCRCPPEDEELNDDGNEESSLEDRREALFAMMGSIWAASGVYGLPGSAYATAGVDANMAFPDVIGGMNDRATKQCLVESLGNQECLVYNETDSDKLLYKGANLDILVERIQQATTALAQIPPH